MPMGVMQVLLFFAFALGFANQVPMFSVSHLAPGRARRSTHGRFSNPGWYPAETRNVRLLSFQYSDVSRRLCDEATSLLARIISLACVA